MAVGIEATPQVGFRPAPETTDTISDMSKSHELAHVVGRLAAGTGTSISIFNSSRQSSLLKNDGETFSIALHLSGLIASGVFYL